MVLPAPFDPAKMWRVGAGTRAWDDARRLGKPRSLLTSLALAAVHHGF